MGIAVTEQFSEKIRWIFQIILCFGVLWTGSRTAFVVMLAYLIIRKWKSWRLLWGIGGIILAGVLAAFAGGNAQAMTRFLTIRIGASTLQGRMLYWEDACKMILRYPFGLGYMGYLCSKT